MRRLREKFKLEPFDYQRCMERNEQIVRERFGDRLTEDRRIEGTDMYFDYVWRLCIRHAMEDEGEMI